jgi:hypothetical protein
MGCGHMQVDTGGKKLSCERVAVLGIQANNSNQ